jgi:hypothetical protein
LKGGKGYKGGSFPLMFQMDKRMDYPLGMLPNTKWEVVHLAKQCALKLALLETPSLPVVERMQIQGNIQNNIRKIPTLKQLGLLNNKDNIKGIPFKDERVYTARSTSMNRQEDRLSFT